MNVKRALEEARSRQEEQRLGVPGVYRRENVVAPEVFDLLQQLSRETDPAQQSEVSSLLQSVLTRGREKEALSATTTSDTSLLGSVFGAGSSIKTAFAGGLSTADSGGDESIKDVFSGLATNLIRFTEIFEERKRGLKELEASGLFQGSNEISEEEVVVIGNRGKSSMFTGLIKLNNLPPRQSVDIERYMMLGEVGERLEMNFALFRTMGGAKKMANQTIIRGHEGKKVGLLNRTVMTQRVPNYHLNRLPKALAKSHTIYSEESSINYIMQPGKFSYNDNFSKNTKFKLKKMSILNKATSLLNRVGESPQEQEEAAAIERLDFITMNQFPVHVPLRFEVLSRYSLFFLKKFMTKFIVNAYINQLKQLSSKPYDLNLPVSMELYQPRAVQNDNPQLREVVRQMADSNRRDTLNSKMRLFTRLRCTGLPAFEPVRKDDAILNFTLKGAQQLGFEPSFKLKALKYSKPKKQAARK